MEEIRDMENVGKISENACYGCGACVIICKMGGWSSP